jgi:elongation factor G
VVEQDIPRDMAQLAHEKRNHLVATLADVDDPIADLFLSEQSPDATQLQAAIRRATLARQFTPVLMGSAIKDKGVQQLLDAVVSYLPNPTERTSVALDIKDKEAPVQLKPSSTEPFVGLAFKLEEGRYGQLTYVKVYQGTLRKGMQTLHVKSGKKIKVSRLVRMHADEMEEIDEASAGEICALFGVDCASGDTFTDPSISFSMTSMYVPPPVISLALTPKGKETNNFSKALNRFQREDPTFRVHLDPESKQTIISGMGELHLDIYVERMKREYSVECTTGKPQVAFRETITQSATFNYTHKKQSGGAGQFARVMGHLAPTPSEEDGKPSYENEFVNQVMGGTIPTNFIPACDKGFQDACEKGTLIGHPVKGVQFVLEDGLAHAVDSSELAFRQASLYAFREAFLKCKPIVLEPVMLVSITAPTEFQGGVLGSINRRKGTIMDTEVQQDYFSATVEAPLNNMFGYSTELRSATQGKGEFTMEYLKHAPVLPSVQEELVKNYKLKKEEK